MMQGRLLAAMLGGVIAVASVVGYWLWQAAPIELPNAPEARYACVSYTPFRGEQSPFDPSFIVPKAQIEEDLNLLKNATNCIRLYAVDQGLDQAVPIAEKLGLKVLLGIWISRENDLNEFQVKRAIELAKAHRASIKGMIVGNEVLLRAEQPPQVLLKYLHRVKSETGLPVTYADVWEFWLRYPELMDAVDFVTIHILPYWEDDPVAAEEGVAHVAAILSQMRQAIPHKPILVGETGYPSAGKQRERAKPGLIEQARFIREFLVLADSQGFDYNVIEAFDQPWKRILEGTVGGYWGVFTESREAKFPIQGPVTPYPDPWVWIAITLILAALISAPAFRESSGRVFTFFTPILSAGAGLIVTLHLDHARFAASTWDEWAVEIWLMLVSMLSAAFVLPQMARGTGGVLPASVAHSFGWARRFWQSKPNMATVLGFLQLSSVVGALIAALGLCFDPRYRDFPTLAFLTPALAFALSWIARNRVDPWPYEGREEHRFAALLLLSAFFIVLNENVLTRPEVKESLAPENLVAASEQVFTGAINGSSLWWGLVLVLLALPWTGGRRKEAAATEAGQMALRPRR